MKLYHHEGAWQLPGKQDRKAERIDVPDRAPELTAWLNDRRVPAAPCTTADVDRGRDESHFWELGPPTRDPPRTSVPDFKLVGGEADFVPIARSAAIAASYGGCPRCQGTWAGQVLAGISTAKIEDLQMIADAIKTHVAELNQELEAAAEREGEGRAH